MVEWLGNNKINNMALYLGNNLIVDSTYLGNINIPSNNIIQAAAIPTTYAIEYLVVAAGGGGGVGNSTSTYGAGGGAGGFLTGSASLTSSFSPLSVTVGVGGVGASISPLIHSTNGGDSSFNSLTSTGGGRGGENASTYTNGGDGGSGGGGLAGASAGNGTAGQGFQGSIGLASTPFYGGSGGGAGTAASGRNAGGGKTWVDGNYYAAGGIGYNASGGLGNGTKGSGGNGEYLTTNQTGSVGYDGVVIIRYASTLPTLTGGTITTAGGYTYHTFTASGTFS